MSIYNDEKVYANVPYQSIKKRWKETEKKLQKKGGRKEKKAKCKRDFNVGL